MNDLFLNDLERLKAHLRTRRYWSTAEIISFGLANHSLRANRNKQLLASPKHNFLRKMSDDEALRHFGNSNQGYYEVLNFKQINHIGTHAA